MVWASFQKLPTGSPCPHQAPPAAPACGSCAGGCYIPARRSQRQIPRAAAAAAPASTAPAPVNLVPSSAAPPAAPPVAIPRSIHDVDNGRLLGFGADLGEDHPGFGDSQYTHRRVAIAQLASTHEIGQPIPCISYTEEEVKVWSAVVQQLEGLFPTHACTQFLRTYPLFGFRHDQVPQLEDISRVLQGATGWSIRPVAGLMHPRDFLAGLAFKVFHSTQYIRHPSNPAYTPEPDVVHELLGHVPMLADTACADLIQAIGMASLGASDKDIWTLTKVYWYTVEFGVVMEADQPKAFGAGILSSYGELQNLAAGVSNLVPLDPFKPLPKMSYKDGYQSTYFTLSSFEEGAQQLRAFARSKQLPIVQ